MTQEHEANSCYDQVVSEHLCAKSINPTYLQGFFL